jgi:hypothetical protein
MKKITLLAAVPFLLSVLAIGGCSASGSGSRTDSSTFPASGGSDSGGAAGGAGSEGSSGSGGEGSGGSGGGGGGGGGADGR